MKRYRFGRLLWLAFAIMLFLSISITLTYGAGVASLTVGGGYGNTGATISTAGALSMDGAFTCKGNLSLYNSSTLRWGYTAASGIWTWMPSTTTASAGTWTLTALTSGNGLKIVCDDDILNGGKYINLYGGSAADTSVWSVGEQGAMSAGASTLASLACTADGTFGGGYGSTGATIATTGNIQTNGTLTVDGTSTLTGNTAVTGTLGVTGASTLSGAATIPVLATKTITCAAGTTVLDSTYYGKVTLVSGAAAETVTLPENGATAGTQMLFIIIGADATAPVFACATADTLITPNDAAADSVTFASGQRIGACLQFVSTGTYWVVVNVGSTTMSITT